MAKLTIELDLNKDKHESRRMLKSLDLTMALNELAMAELKGGKKPTLISVLSKYNIRLDELLK